VGDERDEVVEQIAATLRPMPEVRPDAQARVLVAVAAERERDREARVRSVRTRVWGTRLGLAAAVLFAAFLLRGDRAGSNARVVVKPPSADPRAAVSSRLAGHDADASAALQPVQLVLHAPSAHTVRVVGDFTAWDASRGEMTRDPASGLWSVTLTLPAGRHVYAFLLDDSIWVRDPRAPIARDADFGRPGSVLLVGRP
jgi:hypothetical protein